MDAFDFKRCRQLIAGVMEELCRRNRGTEILLPEMQRMADEAEQFLHKRPEGDRALIACGPGCGSCCVVNVSTLIPEGLAIVRYLRQRDEMSQQQIADKLEDLWRAIRGLDDDERMFLRRSCAFLDEQGFCGIYPARPLLCRSLSSTDAERCRQGLTEQVFGMEPSVLGHLFQQQLYETLFSGIADGLERAGLDGRSFQVSGLVRYLLKNPQAEPELLAGKRLSWQELF